MVQRPVHVEEPDLGAQREDDEAEHSLQRSGQLRRERAPAADCTRQEPERRGVDGELLGPDHVDDLAHHRPAHVLAGLTLDGCEELQIDQQVCGGGTPCRHQKTCWHTWRWVLLGLGSRERTGESADPVRREEEHERDPRICQARLLRIVRQDGAPGGLDHQWLVDRSSVGRDMAGCRRGQGSAR
eukprot:6889053-Prymnesium_polylepis.1